jgi:hypothetical protein
MPNENEPNRDGERWAVLFHHDDAIVYFDSRHRVTKTKLEGGLMGELVEELQPEDIFTSSDWPKRSYRHQLETINRGDGVSVIEF